MPTALVIAMAGTAMNNEENKDETFFCERCP